MEQKPVGSRHLGMSLLVAITLAVITAGAAMLIGGTSLWPSLLVALVPAIGLCAVFYYRVFLPQVRFQRALMSALDSGDFSAIDTGTDESIKAALHRFGKLLQERDRSLSEHCDNLAIGAAEVAYFMEKLRQSSSADFSSAQAVQSEVSQITEGSARAVETAQEAAESARLTHEASQSGQAKIDQATATIRQVAEKVESTGAAVNRLQTSSTQIQRIITIINEVAEQTNLLALNAAIEAARAGEHGRGFAVVADEVRGLSSKTTKATDEINTVLKNIETDSQEAASVMVQLQRSTEASVTTSAEVLTHLQEIGERAQQSDTAVHQIVSALEQYSTAAGNIDQAISGVLTSLGDTRASAETTAQRAQGLSEIAEKLTLQLAKVRLEGIHAEVLSAAQDGAREIGQLFEAALARGDLKEADIFDRAYKPIPDTKPAKFHTRYDGFSDQKFPAVQEPLLERVPGVIYAGAVDFKGYFPTHNKRFSKPLTGDYETDLANNRGKRIFDDRAGSRCGSHTQPFLLQTYKRDTGEVMHDLSVPIYVKGKHWGGFRIGYKARQIT